MVQKEGRKIKHAQKYGKINSSITNTSIKNILLFYKGKENMNMTGERWRVPTDMRYTVGDRVCDNDLQEATDMKRKTISATEDLEEEEAIKSLIYWREIKGSKRKWAKCLRGVSGITGEWQEPQEKVTDDKRMCLKKYSKKSTQRSHKGMDARNSHS